MKLREIISESNVLNEKPMGFLKKAALDIAGIVSSKAAEKYNLGNEANQLRKYFDFHVKSKGLAATSETLLKFLSMMGYPTDSAKKILSTTGAPAQPNVSTITPTTKSNTPAQPSSDPYEKLKGQIRQLKPRPGSKPLPASTVTKLDLDLAKLAKGDKESGTFAAQKILNFANQGYDVGQLAPKWVASSKAGERFLTQSLFLDIEKMLQEYNLSWKSIGLGVRLDENIKDGVFVFAINEDTVLSNKIIDQVLTAAVQDGVKAGVKPLASYSPSKGSATNQTQPASPTSVDQVKKTLTALDPRSKQELIDYLKKNDQLNQLKF